MLYLEIRHNNQTTFASECTGVIELGRQQPPGTEPLGTLQHFDGRRQRLAIVPVSVTQIGRQQLRIEPRSNQRVLVTNGSATVGIEIVDHGPLRPSNHTELSLPVTILLPLGYDVRLSAEPPEEPELADLGTESLAPGQHTLQTVEREDWDASKDAGSVVAALQATLDVFQSVRTQASLIESAIAGARRLAGFDHAQVLFYEAPLWQPTAGVTPSQTVLQKLVRDRKTVWQQETLQEAASLAKVDRVIAAPILNMQGELIAALYCDRHQTAAQRRPITRLDARFIELLAGGVAAGLARIEQEATARKMTTQFEQFFTPELAQELNNHPDLLDGRDADVSILFCDIRGFSRISERIGAKGTFEWINDVMGELSECVIRHQGVLVDYIGDELMAMWGAPQPQEDHATLACRAALDMLDLLPTLNERWEPVVGSPMDLGIGINSGPVRAGNAGSKRKFKYSPLGNTVNLASRVQGATKYLKTRLLVTGSTAEHLNDELLRRKVAEVQVVNIQEPVPLWELSAAKTPQDGLNERFDSAMLAFENEEFRQAAQLLAEILGEWPNDGPSLVLLKRTVNALVDGPQEGHPIWRLGGK